MTKRVSWKRGIKTEAGLGRIKVGLKVSLCVHSLPFPKLMNVFSGDKWAYSFDVVHNVPELINRRGGRVNFVKSLEEHFEGGHNDHTNEVRFISPSFILVPASPFSIYLKRPRD